jgi:hypothetical protein
MLMLCAKNFILDSQSKRKARSVELFEGVYVICHSGYPVAGVVRDTAAASPLSTACEKWGHRFW